MSQPNPSLSLMDDWKLRLARLTELGAAADPMIGAQCRVLTYLIHRYTGTPVAERPSVGSQVPPFYLNQRAIIVLHYVWNNRVAGVKTRHDAEERVQRILHRMAEVASTPNEQTDKSRKKIEGNPSQLHFTLGVPITKKLLSPQTNRFEIAGILRRCKTRKQLSMVVQAWRERLIRDGHDRIVRLLERFLISRRRRPVVVNQIREYLAAGDLEVRVRAIRLLASMGTLGDVGMISDLLALPPAEDEHPRERSALLRTMRQLATTGR